ncbi:Nuclear transcription factor Y subunit B-7 [Camellia lanceoleosa]|uniref:Nuclear transcription factor Y subunit B-7 n=1 Tax=Camellia lanceoleosa TaxID=1840588 RepID=A0ACC0J1Q5_9ERIC|nr:Nuclear transcription factor Y subunit B-7 [Camellia lanceoleosa]
MFKSSNNKNHNHNNNNINNNNNNKEQDRFLPIANVGRIMKKVIQAMGKSLKTRKRQFKNVCQSSLALLLGKHPINANVRRGRPLMEKISYGLSQP